MFTPAFISALDTICAQHGIARSQDTKGRLILVDTKGQDDEGKATFRLFGSRYGLDENDFGALIVYRGTRYKLVGLKTSRPKYPLEMEHQGDGRRFKFAASAEIVKLIKAAQPAPATPAPAQAPAVAASPPPPSAPAYNPYADLAQF
ncbi:MAG: hypothetical protein KGR26_06010 [Cyanobacteria bacterium REEB65]|nr:hypothetical protein [Cyanobacteria bacterium REEB65]